MESLSVPNEVNRSAHMSLCIAFHHNPNPIFRSIVCREDWRNWPKVRLSGCSTCVHSASGCSQSFTFYGSVSDLSVSLCRYLGVALQSFIDTTNLWDIVWTPRSKSYFDESIKLYEAQFSAHGENNLPPVSLSLIICLVFFHHCTRWNIATSHTLFAIFSVEPQRIILHAF